MVDQRAAGIAGIDGGVGLDEEVISRDATAGARQRGDDAAGDGLADAERIADRQHEVADLDASKSRELERRQLLAAGIDPQHGKVGARIGATSLRVELAAVGQRDP